MVCIAAAAKTLVNNLLHVQSIWDMFQNVCVSGSIEVILALLKKITTQDER